MPWKHGRWSSSPPTLLSERKENTTSTRLVIPPARTCLTCTVVPSTWPCFAFSSSLPAEQEPGPGLGAVPGQPLSHRRSPHRAGRRGVSHPHCAPVCTFSRVSDKQKTESSPEQTRRPLLCHQWCNSRGSVIFWLHRQTRLQYRMKRELSTHCHRWPSHSTGSIWLGCGYVVKCCLVNATDAQSIGMWRSCFHVREKRIGQGHFPLCGSCSLPSQSCLSPSSSGTHYSFHFSSSLLSFCSWPRLPCHRENRSQRVNSSLRAMPCVTTLHLHLPCSPCLLSQCWGVLLAKALDPTSPLSPSQRLSLSHLTPTICHWFFPQEQLNLFKP